VRLGPAQVVPVPQAVLPVFVTPARFIPDNLRWTQSISIVLHFALITLFMIPFLSFFPPKTPVRNRTVHKVIPLDTWRFQMKSAVKGDPGGGGGGGDHSLMEAGIGRAPKFARVQLAPPTELFKNPKPIIPVQSTLVGPPELKIENPDMDNFGDPLAKSAQLSNGRGDGSGIGDGNGTGIGDGVGSGLGPGSGAGTGGGPYHPGSGGVRGPSCFYMPNPPYSEEARNAKYSGAVLVNAVVTVDGRVDQPRVIKSPGMGLDDVTISTMKTWRCKAAIGPGGRPVSSPVQFEVNFRLY
jgi:periplasmic protein TonB